MDAPYIAPNGSVTTTRPPFYRFWLHQSQPLLDAERRMTVPDHWEDFRAEFEPLVQRYIVRDWWNMGISCLLAVATFLALPVMLATLPDDTIQILKPILYPLLMSFAALLVYLTAMRIYYVKDRHVQNIQAFVDNQGFANFKCECRLLSARAASKGGYYLYVYPSNNNDDSTQYHDCLRLEFAPERLFACGSVRSSTTLAPDAPPPELESLAADWNELWTKLDDNSTAYKRQKPYFWASIASHFLVLWVLTYVGWNDGALFWVQYGIRFATLLLVVCCWTSLRNLDNGLSSIVNAYVRKFEQQGVCMEYCAVTTFQRFVGGVSRRYLYFFPRNNPALADPSSNNNNNNVVV